MSEYIQVFTTVEKRDEAKKIITGALEARLCGCAQVVGPISSSYWWEGKIEEAEEYLCILKSRQDLYLELEAMIKKNHPYDVPEILAVPVQEGNPDYLDWLTKELKK